MNILLCRAYYMLNRQKRRVKNKRDEYPRLSKAVFRMTIPIRMANLRRCVKENGLD